MRVLIRKSDVVQEIKGSLGTQPGPREVPLTAYDYREAASKRPSLFSEVADLIGMARRQKWLILVLTVLLSITSLVVVLSIQKQYTATALVMLDGRNTRILEPSAGNVLAADGEVEVLKADSLALKVVQRLRLHEQPGFIPEPSALGRLLAGIGESVREWNSAPVGNLDKIEDTAEGLPSEARSVDPQSSVRDDAFYEPPLDPTQARALRIFKNSVTVRRRGLTDVIAIEVEDTNPTLAARYANAYADVYLEEQVATKIRAIERAEAGLTRRLAEIDGELKRAETHVGLRQVYQESLLRLRAITQQRETIGPDARIVSQARPPEVPSFPNRKLLALIAAVASFGAAMGAAYRRDRKGYKIHKEGDVESIAGGPVLATIPVVRKAEAYGLADVSDKLVAEPSSQYSEAIRRLLFTLQALEGRGGKLGVVLVTSTDGQEGKTTLAVSLARAASISGARVLLLDCNLRSPRIHKILDIPDAPGLADLLHGERHQHKLVQRDPRSPCLAIAAGAIEESSVDWLLQPDKVKSAVRTLAAEYDVVLIDGPAVGQYADPLLLASVSDLILLAIRPGVPELEAVLETLSHLRRCSDADIYPVLTFDKS